MNTTFSYGRKEKLKSRKQLAGLFEARQSFLVFPVKVFYLTSSQNIEGFIKVGVGANRRFFKKAVDRNRIKRLLREAYRLNKVALHDYLNQQEKPVLLFFLYIDKVLPPTGLIGSKMSLIIAELIKRLDEQTT